MQGPRFEPRPPQKKKCQFENFQLKSNSGWSGRYATIAAEAAAISFPTATTISVAVRHRYATRGRYSAAIDYYDPHTY